QTRTIIGTPPISARGFPGSRAEAMRAGMMTTGFTGTCSKVRRDLYFMRRYAAMTAGAGRVMSPRIFTGHSAPVGRQFRAAGRKPEGHFRSRSWELASMDSYEWNKIAGAVLGTLVFIFVVKIGAEMLYHAAEPEKPGYIVEGVVEEDAAGAGAPVA